MMRCFLIFSLCTSSDSSELSNGLEGLASILLPKATKLRKLRMKHDEALQVKRWVEPGKVLV